MANQAQVKRIKRGVNIWNEWKRRDYKHTYIDLSEANLSGADLVNANLSEANLSGADLSTAKLNGANLSSANLRGAKLSGTQLRGVNLSKVYLRDVDLSTVDLSGAILREVNLSGAKLNKAELYGADLSTAKLIGAQLRGANLSGANLIRAVLIDANFSGANLSQVNLSDAELIGVNLWGVNLSGANLTRVNLTRANLSFTNLSGANLGGADMTQAILIETNLKKATLTDCRIYGIAAWDVQLQDAKQFNLIVTQLNQPNITIDNLEVAQFVYLLLNNPKIRDIIDTIAKKAVLILGRFTPERKAILDEIRDELRKRNYLPILFDFEKPTNRDITETVSTLAHMARFVIADITDAKSIPQELSHIVPFLPSVPIQPLLLSSQSEYGMFEHFARFPWVLPIYHYTDQESLLASLKEKVIDPAENKAQELAK